MNYQYFEHEVEGIEMLFMLLLGITQTHYFRSATQAHYFKCTCDAINQTGVWAPQRYLLSGLFAIR